jgi:hypothetical protein
MEQTIISAAKAALVGGNGAAPHQAFGKSDHSGLMHHLKEDQLMVLMVRHGQPGRGPEIEGLIGPPLTALGHRQAQRVARRLQRIPLAHIYSSDMARSYQTAAAVAEGSTVVRLSR